MFPESQLIFAALSMGRNEEEWRTEESYLQSSAGTVTFEGEEKEKSRERVRAPSDQALYSIIYGRFIYGVGSRQAGKLLAN